MIGRNSSALPLDPLHRDEGDVIVLVNFIDGTDVGVIESGRRLGFSQEADFQLFVFHLGIGNPKPLQQLSVVLTIPPLRVDVRRVVDQNAVGIPLRSPHSSCAP